jgi:hypothetical protein
MWGCGERQKIALRARLAENRIRRLPRTNSLADVLWEGEDRLIAPLGAENLLTS